MQNEQINLTAMEIATIHAGMLAVASEGKLENVDHVRICVEDKENKISIYGSDGILFTINRGAKNG